MLVLVLNAETSMFGAGNLESSSPYGLTKTEKVIVENKKVVKKNEEILKRTNIELENLSERFDGVNSLIESESLKLNKVFVSLNNQIEDFKLFKQTSNLEINKNTELIANMQVAIDLDIQKIKLKIIQNENNIKNLKDSFDKIVKLANNINSNYVTKKEFDKLLLLLDKKLVNSNYVTKKEFDKILLLLDKKSVKNISSTTEKISNAKSSKELLDEAKHLFKIDYFTKAKIIFEDLIAIEYRPAESNFYIGEINYYRKNYKDALHFYKKSMTLDDKAEYLPRLLLHSAISFEELGDKENANNFYSTLVDIYPVSDEAKEASKKLNYK